MSERKKSNLPILITSAVEAVAPYTAITDNKVRIRHTIDALIKLRSIAPKNPIVICDGSGYDFEYLRADNVIADPVEVLKFNNNVEMVKLKGKGFGEGEIVNYAIENSKILTNAYAFAKCTAKLWPTNLQEILRIWNGGMLFDGVFSGLKSVEKGKLLLIQTKFYITEIEIFKDILSSAHSSVDDRNGFYLEHAYLDAILKHGTENFVSSKLFLINGYSGSDGSFQTVYAKEFIKENLKRFILKKYNKKLFYDKC